MRTEDAQTEGLHLNLLTAFLTGAPPSLRYPDDFLDDISYPKRKGDANSQIPSLRISGLSSH